MNNNNSTSTHYTSSIDDNTPCTNANDSSSNDCNININVNRKNSSSTSPVIILHEESSPNNRRWQEPAHLTTVAEKHCLVKVPLKNRNGGNSTGFDNIAMERTMNDINATSATTVVIKNDDSDDAVICGGGGGSAGDNSCGEKGGDTSAAIINVENRFSRQPSLRKDMRVCNVL